MKDKMFFGIIAGIGGISMASGMQTIYNYYILPVIRHKEVMDKIDGFDNRLKKVELLRLSPTEFPHSPSPLSSDRSKNGCLLRSEMKKNGHDDV